MVRPKLAYDKETDRKTAVADYICKNVASFKFTGAMKDQKIKLIKNPHVFSLTQNCEAEDKTRYEVGGDATFVCVVENEDDEFESFNKFSCYCKLVRGEQDEPVVSEVSLIMCTGY